MTPAETLCQTFDQEQEPRLRSTWAELESWMDTIPIYESWRSDAATVLAGSPADPGLRERVAHGDSLLVAGTRDGFDLAIAHIAESTGQPEALSSAVQEAAMWWREIGEHPILVSRRSDVFQPLYDHAIRVASESIDLTMTELREAFDVADPTPDQLDEAHRRYNVALAELEEVPQWLPELAKVLEDAATRGQEHALAALDRGLAGLGRRAAGLGPCATLAELMAWMGATWDTPSAERVLRAESRLLVFTAELEVTSTVRNHSVRTERRPSTLWRPKRTETDETHTWRFLSDPAWLRPEAKDLVNRPPLPPIRLAAPMLVRCVEMPPSVQESLARHAGAAGPDDSEFMRNFPNLVAAYHEVDSLVIDGSPEVAQLVAVLSCEGAPLVLAALELVQREGVVSDMALSCAHLALEDVPNDLGDLEAAAGRFRDAAAMVGGAVDNVDDAIAVLFKVDAVASAGVGMLDAASRGRRVHLLYGSTQVTGGDPCATWLHEGVAKHSSSTGGTYFGSTVFGGSWSVETSSSTTTRAELKIRFQPELGDR